MNFPLILKNFFLVYSNPYLVNIELILVSLERAIRFFSNFSTLNIYYLKKKLT